MLTAFLAARSITNPPAPVAELSMARFYGYFAAAYGTFWFALFVAAVVTQTRVDAGAFGFCGFPIIAFFYAVFRSLLARDTSAEIRSLKEHVRWLQRELDLRDRDALE